MSIEKNNKLPKNFQAAHNHSTHVVVLPKMETAQEDRILKKLIKEDYKYVFRDILIVRRDQIKKKDFGNTFRGRTITAVEYRTVIPKDESDILNTYVIPLMSIEKDRMKKRIEDEKNKCTD